MKKVCYLATVTMLLILTGCSNQNTDVSAEANLAEETSVETETTEATTEEENTDNVQAEDQMEGIITEEAELTFPLGTAVNIPGAFTGTAYLAPMIENESVYNFPQTNNVTFEPGARSNWHSHGGMAMLVTGGVGYYQEEGKAAQIIRKGDVIQCEEGVRHWHGATPDSWFSQLVIYDSHYVGEAEEQTPVTDEEYDNLQTEEYAGRIITDDNQFMFQRGDTPVTLDTFNGPVYISSVMEENAAEAPGLHYVVFEPGVINNWHTHEGGQILIATDGVGYHQLEGEPVQVLHAGDVAYCPPGEKHWHGGSADTSFAHIAVNTNPELTGLEWFDRISDEEYNQLQKDEVTSNDTIVTNGGDTITLSDLEHQESGAESVVYYTSDISPEGLMAVYEALGAEVTGENVAVKLSTGEPPASNYLDPNLIKDLVASVNGTIVECNTAYGGERTETALHYQVAKDHGFSDIADFVVMDEDGSITIPVEGGSRLTENYVGAHFPEYDGFLVLSHFKGHAMAGMGGAIKNISIGIASKEGKSVIHTAGASHDSPWGGEQDPFLESMAEAGKAVSDAKNGNMLYVNVLNRLSVDCDCDGNPAEPDMHDIGIMISTDPVAIDQASVDLVHASPDNNTSLIERMESRNAYHVLEHGEAIGLGNRTYELRSID